VRGRRERRRNHLLEDFMETRKYWKMKEAALDALFEELALEEAMDLS